jgi:transposase
MRDIVDAIRYLTHNGPVWRALPADFPPTGTVYWWADKWQAGGCTERMHDDLRERIRLTAGRKAAPTAAIIDSQSVKGSEMIARPRHGYDAGKKINGTKRHLAVDTLGLLLTVLITAASVQDRDAAKPLLWNLRRAFPAVKLAWADGGYAGKLITWARTRLRLRLEIVKRPDDLHTFKVLPLLGRKVWAARLGAGKRWSGCLRLVSEGVLADAGRGRGILAGAVDDHGVDPAQQRGGARDAGGGVPRPGCGGRRRGRLQPGTIVRRPPARRRQRRGSAQRTWPPHRVEPQHRPYRAPDGQPQAGPAAAGDVRVAARGPPPGRTGHPAPGRSGPPARDQGRLGPVQPGRPGHEDAQVRPDRADLCQRRFGHALPLVRQPPGLDPVAAGPESRYGHVRDLLSYGSFYTSWQTDNTAGHGPVWRSRAILGQSGDPLRARPKGRCRAQGLSHALRA